MNDDEIRALVRAAIQKHLGAPAGAMPAAALPPTPPALHPSFGRYVLARTADDTLCIVEPAVGCNHCGYCQCHGH